jgi:hypothetical protein
LPIADAGPSEARRFVRPRIENRNPMAGSGVRFGLTEAGDPVTVLPLAAFLKQFRALEPLEHIPFAAQLGRRTQTPML